MLPSADLASMTQAPQVRPMLGSVALGSERCALAIHFRRAGAVLTAHCRVVVGRVRRGSTATLQ
jgi:hypothetical protein